MKFPKELNENESDLKKNTQKSNGNTETKTLEENNGIISEEGDTSNRVIEPNTTALIPPWIRSSLGLSEKGSRSNHRCLKTLRTSGDRLLAGENGEMKSDPDDICLKTNFGLVSSSSNDIVEVNIGNEADFSEEVSDMEGKSSSAWNNKASKHNQYDCNIFGVYKDNRVTRPELTSIDVVVPAEEQEEEKRKVRVHKTKNRAHKKLPGGGSKNEVFKNDSDALCKTNARHVGPKTDSGVLNSNGIKQLDARILLLCGKNTLDKLKEDDVSLLEDMKNQIGHKEGFEKLFNEIKESALLGRSLNKEITEGKKERIEKKEEKEAGETIKKERAKVLTKTAEPDISPNVKDLLAKTVENDMKMINNILTKSKAMEEERKYIEEIRKHYEKKKQSQHRLGKYPEEAEIEKDRKTLDKCKMFPQKVSADKEKKNKWRQSDLSVMEKTVSEILQKFIKFYRFQVPPDIVTSMKKNIIQTLQSEYPETGLKKNFDVIFAVQEELKNTDTEKDSMHSLLMEEQEDKFKDGSRQIDETPYKGFETNPEEDVVSRDEPMDNKHVKSQFRTLLTNVKETKPLRENDLGEEQNFKDLKSDFDICLKSIQAQLDITGTRLCSIILEKGELHDASNQKLRIFHDFSTGMTEFVKLYNDKLHTGSPEGDNTSVKVCRCNTTVPIKANCNQFSQTQEKEMTKNGTQTDYMDTANRTDLASGIYRIIKTAELGSFYLCPEAIDEVADVKTIASEACEPLGNDVFDTYKDEVVKSISRESFISEKIPSANVSKKLRRAFKSDCLGLNKIELEELTRAESKISILNILTENSAGEKQELPVLMTEEEETVLKENVKSDDREVFKSESYHVGCVWFWNGKKMNPGVDLKVHVEDLLREKLREILNEVRVTEERKTREIGEDEGTPALVVDAGTDIIQDRSLEKNLEIRKTHGKFCITNANHLETDVTPFIFSGCNEQDQNLNIQIPAEDKALQGLDINDFVKSVREVGTQNSQHTFVSLNITKLKPRSKFCTVAKFSKQRPRKHVSPQKLRCERPRTSSAKALSFAENVGEAKKVKLEFRESDEMCSSNDKCSNGENLRECFSVISNESSSSSDGPVRVKLIGIEVSKEKKVSEEGEFYESSGKETKKISSDEERGSLRELPKKFKHWELIENVLNRVNQKEKDSLWNDIRDFVKKKIGRDINDEGAREVCIEIEQDVPKFFKGKTSQSVVAKGNYTRNEGDVEVEVDLTLDDLERILRHRQKKLRRRNNYHKMKTDSKNSFSSSGTSSDGTRNYTSNCSAFGGGGTVVPMLKNTEAFPLLDDNLQDQTLPLPIQIFLWRQISPFIRPKLGKLHEASCTELKEACKSFEKVLVQNIQYGLSPSLTDAFASIPRWRLIQAAFPHVMHCTAMLLHNRKDTNLQSLGATETKMLYTLHWILLVAAEECADADHENGVFQASPFYYLFSVPAITLFIYLFAPIHHHLKESDFQTYRLENGLKMWQALWEYRHPDTPCFTAHVKPKPRMLWNKFTKGNHLQFGDVFMGRQQSSDEGAMGGESSQSYSASASFSSEQFPNGPGGISVRIEPTKAADDESNWVSSPKDTVFPETIPEESSSTEEEHVVIFRLPSLTESDGVERPGSLYKADASIFHMPVNRTQTAKPTLTIDQGTSFSSPDSRPSKGRPPPIQKMGSSTDRESISSKGKPSGGHKLHHVSTHSSDFCAATFLDVAVLRCLFMSQWPEEGVFWALQFFYHRLREMSEEIGTQEQPRKRSNSLPIPKIEVSLYQSPEMKKKDPSKDFIEVPEVKDVARRAESPYNGWKQSHESVSHTRRASEKSVSKKKMKMADLRAFVETKLLSKSEKTLEKIGAEEQKPLFVQQEYHRSLDAGEENLARPSSAFAKIFEHRSEFKPLGWGNLVKGKSMPSLSCLTDDSSTRGFAGDHEKHFKSGRMLGAHSHTITNPIITVTEHTPTPSPDFLKRQISIESQLDEISLHGKQTFYQERKPSLARSQTDSNITYTCEEVPEAPGASNYITKDGDINIHVVLKAVHSAALRDNICCTLRVCEVLFNLLEILMEMGVLKHHQSRGNGGNAENKNGTGKEDKDSCHSSEQDDAKESYSTAKNLHEKHFTPHDLVLNTVLRVYKHLGCPHGCGDGQRGPPADFLRSQGQTILSKVHRSNPKQFTKFLRNFVRNQTLAEILEFFHSYVGFCVDPSSLLSPLRMNQLWLLARKAGQIYDQKRSSNKSPEISTQGGYATNFGAGLKGGGSRGVEGHIMTSIFKTLVTRLVGSLKELKTQENMPLYCDARQLISYVKEVHGGIFRRVALSGLMDSSHKSSKKQENMRTAKILRHVSRPETEDQPEVHGSAYYLDERGQRKILIKKRSTSSTCTGKSFPLSQGTLDTESTEEGVKSQSPLANVRKKQHSVLVPRQSEKSMSISDSGKSGKAEKASKLMPKIVSWFKKDHTRTDSTDSHDDLENAPGDGTFPKQQSVRYRTLGKSSSKGSSGDLKQAIQKTRKRVEDQIKKNFSGFRKGKKKDGSVEESSGIYTSRKSSMDYGDTSRESGFVIYRERKLVQLQPVLKGMMRFSFLLEMNQPGSVPDHHFLAAVLDLPQTPVVSRAALLLECAYLVHNCNKGQWPPWMKLNYPVFRPSMPNQNRGPPTGMRRTHILQRSSGKLFYQWAEAIGNRLEEMLQKDKLHIPDVVSMVTEESKQKELFIEDEEEDFLDEASGTMYGNECPIALRMIACILLLEITAFLRETYQSLPKTSRSSGKDRPPQWERMYSKEANRRWSMALSSMGHSQASAQSLQSIAGDRETTGGQSERKISFVLHEPDNESEGSSNTTVTNQGEDGQAGDDKDKKNKTRATTGGQPPSRPLLLRRGTATNATGSFKRRSLKLRRGTKEGIKESDSDFKRTDSVQSKRKVSSFSDKSDTSEQGAAGEVSGEESPGILSDDQPPESPSDSNDTDDTSKNMPWLKVVVQLAHSFNFYCSHQSFCHPFCYRRHMRACARLMKAVRKIYGEESGFLATFERENEGKQHESKKEKVGRGRKVSDQTSTQPSPVRRKDSLGRKEKTEKVGEGVKSRDPEYDVEKSKVADSAKKKWTPIGRPKEGLPILKYLKTQVRNVFHAPLAVLVKGAVVLTEDLFVDIIPVAWELLLESDQEVAASAASLFILCSVRAPNHVSDLMHHALSHQDTSVRINATLRFQVLWKLRYQVWPRMEEGAHVTFKVPPPGIEFTLPSPKIGIESLPVVDPPWIPQVQTKVEEVTISQESHRSLVTATKTRKKQQTELITMALQAEENKKRVERENFLISTIPITVQAAYQPSLFHIVDGGDHDEGDDEQTDVNQGRNTTHHINTVHSLFPSCLCSAVIQIVNLLDDAAVSSDGNAVYEVAYSVIWNCLVEDSALFLRYILERITREKQDQMFKILRHLIRFLPKLPQQAAFALYNYIIGYIMFYVRSSHEEGQQYIGTALSILWMVVHSVHGIMFKDLKQILRKEQCDASILLTANVPSAKKIVVHGPHEQDSGSIPSQFPVQEDTQFCQILRESLDFFGVEDAMHREYFLVDQKTRQIHNPSAYVRDFYFFKRSQYPQLELVHMRPDDAFNGLQRQELIHKFVEIGKVLLTWAILKNVDMVVQRVVFLHEELMKLPSFPRKALEADLDLYKGGELGKELMGLDVLHKFMWVRLISRMFEAMAGNFAYSGDIQLLLNVLNGALILHSEDSCILRYVMATYINAAHNFKNIFSTSGYLLIMPTLLQIYSNHQTNKLVTRTVEYCVKQFYLMNRKPFILQMFGSLSSILDTDEEGHFGDAHKVQAKCLFRLLLSLETPSPDPLNIGELVKEEKPLRALDFCYHDESEMVTVLDCICLCSMVVAYASDSVRGHQMLIILEAILPLYLQQIQKPSYEKDGKTEKEIIQQLAVAIRTLVHNSEALAKNYNGPQRSSPEHKGSSQKNYARGPYSPGFEFDEDSHSRYLSDHSRSKILYEREDLEDSEVLRNEFRKPRDILLSLVSYFYTKCTARLAEINKKAGYDGKSVEILDVRSHLRLVEIAHSLLKVAPYDPDTMGCRGLQRYINDILPSTEWSNDAMRPALITILRRLDKTFNKIYKKASIRRHTDWDAAAGLLKGVYETVARCPYIAHMQHLKTLINTCQSLILGEANNVDVPANEPLVVRVLMTMVPPPHFCTTVVRLVVMQILAMGENYSLEQVCGTSVFSNKKKTESMLMNLIIPLCMRVGSGRKDVPRMRQQDISFALTVVLNAMCPPATLTAQNIKSLSEMRSGSLAVGKEAKKPVKLPQSTYQVSFLALKIIIVCFENELTNDWLRIAKTVKDVARVIDLGNVFWNFLDFVASQRTPLYVLLLPFINQKVNAQPLNDQQRHIQFVIREKLKGYSLPVTKCKSALLIELAHEIKELKEELENGKLAEDVKVGDQINASNSQSGDIAATGHARHHRPSLIGGLFSGAADLTSKTNQLANEIQMKLLRSQRNSVSSTGDKKVVEDAMTTVNEDTKGAGAAQKESKDQQRKLSVKLRFVSSVEMKDDSGETSVTPLSPTSPNDDSSGEANGKSTKPRLQRSKAQSRKTFKLRKSRKSRLEKGEEEETEKHSHSTPTTPTQQLSLDQLREIDLKDIAFAEEVNDEERYPAHALATDSECVSPEQNGSKMESTNGSNGSSQQSRSSQLGSYRNNLLKAELSLEEDTTSAVSQTSSTSGYRESCSLITMTMESPTLMRRSSIPATTSPDSSLTSNGADETAVLARSSSSQHSLMMLFETQDEDTLI